MKSLLGLVLLACVVSVGQASIVIHDGQPGIVAYAGAATGDWALDSLGRVWNISGSGFWERHLDLDVPIPVADIKFWEVWTLMSMSDEHFWVSSGVWHSGGTWPASAVPETAPNPARAAVAPNPSAGSCRVAFQTVVAGPVSVQVFDASGRLVRQLHDGSLPIGEFSLAWDGRDDVGQEVPAGVYLAKVQTAMEASTAKVTLAR